MSHLLMQKFDAPFIPPSGRKIEIRKNYSSCLSGMKCEAAEVILGGESRS